MPESPMRFMTKAVFQYRDLISGHRFLYNWGTNPSHPPLPVLCWGHQTTKTSRARAWPWQLRSVFWVGKPCDYRTGIGICYTYAHTCDQCRDCGIVALSLTPICGAEYEYRTPGRSVRNAERSWILSATPANSFSTVYQGNELNELITPATGHGLHSGLRLGFTFTGCCCWLGFGKLVVVATYRLSTCYRERIK